jgi:hypothetical protein
MIFEAVFLCTILFSFKSFCRFNTKGFKGAEVRTFYPHKVKSMNNASLQHKI